MKAKKNHESRFGGLNPITLAVKSTNLDPQQRSGRIFSLTFLNY